MSRRQTIVSKLSFVPLFEYCSASTQCVATGSAVALTVPCKVRRRSSTGQAVPQLAILLAQSDSGRWDKHRSCGLRTLTQIRAQVVFRSATNSLSAYICNFPVFIVYSKQMCSDCMEAQNPPSLDHNHPWPTYPVQSTVADASTI
jgi:hypothetical protein